MNASSSVLINEQQRLERAVSLFSQKIGELPRGSVQLKKRAKQNFCYHVFRDESRKLKWVYLGNESSKKAAEMQKLIAKRIELEEKRKQMQRDLHQISRMLAHQ